jgi:hypothetical protein
MDKFLDDCETICFDCGSSSGPFYHAGRGVVLCKNCYKVDDNQKVVCATLICILFVVFVCLYFLL